MTDFRVSNPHNTKMIHFTDCGVKDNKILEKKLHCSLKENRHKGEWFLLNKRQVIEVINIMKNYGTKNV